MADHFRILGIKALKPEFRDRVSHLEKVEFIQKALFEQDSWLYFYKGVIINQEEQTIWMSKETLADFSLFDIKGLKISVSAIVGKNGSGKSSIVDLMIRMINNLAAAVMGEGINYAAAEHLHFIDYVFGSLCFQIGRIVYVLEERGRNIKLFSYERHRGSGLFFQLREKGTVDLLNGNLEIEHTHKPLRRNPRTKKELKKLFYTLVCNYSLYGFNYKDYLTESTPIERLSKIRGISSPEKMAEEDKVWLKGIFHKNDGYQTPVVLYPMRVNGILDMAKENELAKERLISLLFYQDKPGHFPFRTINGNLRIIAFKVSELQEKRFSRDNQKMLESIGIGRTRNVSKHLDQVYDAILDFWAKVYGFSTGMKSSSRIDAYDYVVYKTLKIVFNYKKYQSIFKYLSLSDFDVAKLNQMLLPLSQDFSHVTKKLRRTIAYLKSSIYSLSEQYFNLEELDNRISLFARQFESEKDNTLTEIDLLPPPIFDIDLIVSHEPELNGYFKFSGLSSGEKQLAYTISNCMYHLVNINSSWDDLYNDRDHNAQIKYRYVNVVFDEIELYYHPEMQRLFLHYLMESLSSVEFKHLKGLNIILATHSPFILSDIPSTNILKLGGGQRDEETYGANIIDILGSSFFLDYTIGEEVRLRLYHIAQLHQNRRTPEAQSEYRQRKNEFAKVIAMIGDPYLKDTMCQLMKDMNKETYS